ncbi:MAG: hypothetical protein ABGZ17_16685 [Planctomycetaceae bacterium]
MRALLILAMALINAPAEEQELMVYDLYAADPVLAVEVLDVADQLRGNPLRGSFTLEDNTFVEPRMYSPEEEDNINGWHIEDVDPVDDSTKAPRISGGGGDHYPGIQDRLVSDREF